MNPKKEPQENPKPASQEGEEAHDPDKDKEEKAKVTDELKQDGIEVLLEENQ